MACYAVEHQVQMSLAKVTHKSHDEKPYLAKSFAVYYYTLGVFLQTETWLRYWKFPCHIYWKSLDKISCPLNALYDFYKNALVFFIFKGKFTCIYYMMSQKIWAHSFSHSLNVLVYTWRWARDLSDINGFLHVSEFSEIKSNFMVKSF